ncbi:MAG: hypothetical protein JOZ90_01380 [Alphaproteobacteria bacterium]|nr:hypothetical protein [Alphaproteobacteria bacterium]MBV9370242.1 hypothetical protein [Alphaproteobacteria bacterium]MBV9899727.1 hypothetical protein [Alphaproteobacteria bacterium]
MNQYEFVLAIILIVTLGSAMRTYLKRRPPEPAEPENDRLREEVVMLRDRIAVLERITVEKENSLEREIEKLRDR